MTTRLRMALAKVVDGVQFRDGIEVQDVAGRWYQLRIRPYVTQDNKIDGASVVLVDIDPIKRELERVKAAAPTESKGD